MHEQVEKALEDIRPALAMHGGGVSLVSCDLGSGVVKVRLSGACKGCPMAGITLKMGVESAIMGAVPAVREVVAVEGD